MRKRVLKCFDKPSLTKQYFKDECDINKLVKKFCDVGSLHAQTLQGHASGQYGDFSEIPDYRSALDQVRRAGESFNALPAVVRARFQNDIAGFLDFCHDERNAEELRAMGLLKDPAPEGVVDGSMT